MGIQIVIVTIMETIGARAKNQGEVRNEKNREVAAS